MKVSEILRREAQDISLLYFTICRQPTASLSAHLVPSKRKKEKEGKKHDYSLWLILQQSSLATQPLPMSPWQPRASKQALSASMQQCNTKYVFTMTTIEEKKVRYTYTAFGNETTSKTNLLCSLLCTSVHSALFLAGETSISVRACLHYSKPGRLYWWYSPGKIKNALTHTSTRAISDATPLITTTIAIGGSLIITFICDA